MSEVGFDAGGTLISFSTDLQSSRNMSIPMAGTLEKELDALH